MLYITILFAVFLASTDTKGDGDTPVIKWRSCGAEETPRYDACFQVKFGNGLEDTMVLQKYMGFDSVLMGTLKGDPSVTVAVSTTESKGEWLGKPFQASFVSKFVPNCGVFNVAADGSSTCDKNDAFDRMMGNEAFIDYVHVPFEEAGNRADWVFLPSEESRALDPAGYKLKMVGYYDYNMVKRFGSITGAEERIAAVLGHASTLYTLASLGTKVEITMVKLEYLVEKTWVATETDLNGVRSTAASEGQDANAYFFFGSENDQFGTVGIAYIGSTCAKKGYRTGIVEYFQNDGKTGAILAHELGHNLGMNHDFVGSPGKRRNASDGTSCTDVDGIMDYRPVQNTWTKCSVEDFKTYVESVKPFCLERLAPSSVTTTTTTTSTTTAEGSCTDVSPESCAYNKQLYGCLGQWWNSEYCSKTCGLC